MDFKDFSPFHISGEQTKLRCVDLTAGGKCRIPVSRTGLRSCFDLRSKAKQSKANFAFGLFWTDQKQSKAKQSAIFKSNFQSKEKQSKAK